MAVSYLKDVNGSVRTFFVAKCNGCGCDSYRDGVDHMTEASADFDAMADGWVMLHSRKLRLWLCPACARAAEVHKSSDNGDLVRTPLSE